MIDSAVKKIPGVKDPGLFIKRLKKWIAFYRSNINRWVEDFLHIRLKPFQQILLTMMSDSSNGFLLGSRGIGKTYITAIFSCWKAINFPKSVIIVCSKTKGQGGKIIEKIQQLIPNAPLLNMEIKKITDNQKDIEIEFYNDSLIRVVCQSDTARGERATVLILDESRLLTQRMVGKILEPFLTTPRHPGFMDKPEYQDYPYEKLQELFLTSGWYSSNWNYQVFKTYAASMIQGYPYFAVALPYQLAYKERLLTKERILAALNDPNYNDIDWKMEMEAEFYEGSSGGLYSYEDLSSFRNLKIPSYPLESYKLLGDKKFALPPKEQSEVRILTADIALMASTKKNDNDASSIVLNRCFIGDQGNCQHNITYLENNEGFTTNETARRIRRLFHEFQGDALGIDTRGLGLGVVDALLEDIYDPDTGILYQALTCVNNDEIAKRCHARNPIPALYAIIGTSDFNSRIALGLRDAIKQGKVSLLASEDDFEEEMMSEPKYENLSIEDKFKLRLPFINTSLAINELISLDFEEKGGVVKVKERSGMRKDRYSSLAYNIEISKMIVENRRMRNQQSIEELIFNYKPPRLK